MRRTADVVIVGGGIIGASIAYHLTKKGVRDILVLERDRLGFGSTGKNAGGIRLQFSSEINVKLSQRSLPHIERFADEIGTDPHFHQVGYLFLITEERDVAAFERSLAMWSRLGIPARRVTAAEAKALFKHARTDDVRFATFCAKDGYADPSSLLNGYVARARDSGAEFVEGAEVVAFACADGKGAAVRTNRGELRAPTVGDAAGPWPAQGAKVRTGWAGLYEDTPDKHPILGRVEELPGFVCAAGFSGHGIMHAPATGEAIAELITKGKTTLDIGALAASRFRTGQLVREHNV